MNKKAIILDLDNTIYPVSSIGGELFGALFQLIIDNGGYHGDMENIKQDIMIRPFQKVAADYGFSKELKEKGVGLLKYVTYEKKIIAYEDYNEIKKLPCKKFLVTAGFPKMQQSKIKQLGIGEDFDEIHIIDPDKSRQTKKDVFQAILHRYRFLASDMLVVGDDPESEIQAAMELGIDVVLYDKMDKNPGLASINKITDFSQINDYL